MTERDDQEPLLAVIGPTASGKTALAVELCRAAARAGDPWEVLSLDSMLVYRGLDIGTAKPDAAERRGVPHHLIDLVDPEVRFDVTVWLAAAEAAEADCRARGVTPLYAGGTAFYLKALVSGLFEGPPVDLALRARLEAVYEAGEASQTIVIVDEAYHEFAHDGTASALTLLPGRERLIISRTMSKAFALAGARVGYMAAAPEVTDALRLVRLPYHLSAITQATALAALHHRVALMADVEDIKRQRDRIVSELQRMGLKPAASDSNYVFFGGLENPHEVWQGLLDAGVLVRDVGIPGHLRVTAGTETETTAFLEALERILAGRAVQPA